MINKLKKIKEGVISLVFPRRCPVCDRVVRMGEQICTPCRAVPVRVKNPRCLKCGKGLDDDSKEYCYDCSVQNHVFNQGVALYEYNSVCDSIYKFKYSGRAEYAEYFGKAMAVNFEETIRNWHVDAILSVPLHKSKEKSRGYNQAQLLAENMARYLNIPYYSNYIIRKNKTIPLKELDPKTRQINLKNAFIIGLDDVKLNRVVIVDDIYTTGSTIDELTRLLRTVGVREVFFVTLAIGTGL